MLTNTTVKSGGQIVVSSGGKDTNPAISSGGLEIISNNGSTDIPMFSRVERSGFARAGRLSRACSGMRTIAVAGVSG